MSALKAFKNAFAQRLSEELPSIAIATLSPNNDGPVNSNVGILADYAGRGLPLLLIDSRAKPPGGYPSTVEEANQYIDEVNNKLKIVGSRNVSMLLLSNMIYMHVSL